MATSSSACTSGRNRPPRRGKKGKRGKKKNKNKRGSQAKVEIGKLYFMDSLDRFRFQSELLLSTSVFNNLTRHPRWFREEVWRRTCRRSCRGRAGGRGAGGRRKKRAHPPPQPTTPAPPQTTTYAGEEPADEEKEEESAESASQEASAGAGGGRDARRSSGSSRRRPESRVGGDGTPVPQHVHPTQHGGPAPGVHPHPCHRHRQSHREEGRFL